MSPQSEYQDKCPIWGTAAQKLNPDNNREWNSPRAGGKFVLKDLLELSSTKNLSLGHKAKLSSYILKANLNGNIPTIDSDILLNINSKPAKTVIEKYNSYLKTLRYLHPKLGEEIPDIVYIDSYSDNDLQVLQVAIASKTAEIIDADIIDADIAELKVFETEALNEGLFRENGSNYFVFTMKGFQYLDQLGVQLSNSDQIFVAMWFGDDTLNKLYREVIAPAIRDAGYSSMKIDDSEHNDKIDDKIIAEIRKSKAIIADITCGLATPINGWSIAKKVGAPRGGVFYEAGFAKGLGLPVIWMVDEKIAEIENVSHFDIRQYNQIRWARDDTKENFKDTRERLHNRIEATLGRGNHSS